MKIVRLARKSVFLACMPFSFVAVHGNRASFIQPRRKHIRKPISLPSKGNVHMHQPTTDDAGAKQSLPFWGISLYAYDDMKFSSWYSLSQHGLRGQ